MSGLVFTCPVTRKPVQHWDDDASEPGPDHAYVGVQCPACGRLHLLNPKTGKLLGEK